jgi:2-enoate reductase
MGVRALTNTQVEEIGDKNITVIDPEGKKQKIDADTVVLSMGYHPNMALYESLQGMVKVLYAVGDCKRPRSVRDAIHGAAFVARQI